MKINERIKTRRKELKLTQAAIASLVKVSRVSITQWELGDTSPKGKNLFNLAKALKCTTEWLLFGVDSAVATTSNVKGHNYQSNYLPLISWVQAGSWSELIDDFQPEDTDQYYPCPEKTSSLSFALKVVGESMLPDYVDGEIIYVDPEVEARNGSYVVVRQNNDSEVTFKKLIIEGSEKMLKAVNPDWPNPIINMLPDAKVCGVVVGSYKKRN